MSRFGKFNPASPENTSSLFVYGESPLASEKLNRWNGNLEAAINQLTQAAIVLFGGDCLLPGLHDTPLKVRMREIPEMTVRVLPGRAFVSGWLAGLTETEIFPEIGAVPAPSEEERIDLIALNREGNLLRVQGGEGTPPPLPDAPGNPLILALLHLRPGMTCILETDDGVNGYIEDMRPHPVSGMAHVHSSDPKPMETADGERTRFSTARRFRSGSLTVYLNGILMLNGPESDFTEDADRSGYTFCAPPRSGDIVQHLYIEE